MSQFPPSMFELVDNVAKAYGHSPEVVTPALEAFKRKQNMLHPKGIFDKVDRLRLDEACPLCSSIREPSRSYPFSHMQHGRTVAHIAALFAANPLHVKRVVKAFEVTTRQAPVSDLRTSKAVAGRGNQQDPEASVTVSTALYGPGTRTDGVVTRILTRPTSFRMVRTKMCSVTAIIFHGKACDRACHRISKCGHTKGGLHADSARF